MMMHNRYVTCVYVYLYLLINCSCINATSTIEVYLRFSDCRVGFVTQFHRVDEKQNYTNRTNLQDSEVDVRNRIKYKKQTTAV